MTEEEKGTEEQAAGAEESADGAKKSTRERVGQGFKDGMGVLSAFKDALEETIHEARERGDLSAEKAKEVVREALDKAQAAGERAKEKFDFAAHDEVDAVKEAFEGLRARVAKLEESVFGASQEPEAAEPTEEPAGAATEAEGGSAEKA